MKIRTLTILQFLFALASVTYLLVNAWRVHLEIEPLSPAPIALSLILFGLYTMSIFLVRLKSKIWYRIAMGCAILFFGGGGVIGNIMRYMDSGLEQYASFSALALAVSINAFGTFWNVFAVLGLYRKN